MLTAIGYGIGAGLAFCGVFIPLVLLVRSKPDTAINDKLVLYWEKHLAIDEEMLAVHTQLRDTLNELKPH